MNNEHDCRQQLALAIMMMMPRDRIGVKEGQR
jgi:hypothetical protein